MAFRGVFCCAFPLPRTPTQTLPGQSPGALFDVLIAGNRNSDVIAAVAASYQGSSMKKKTSRKVRVTVDVAALAGKLLDFAQFIVVVVLYLKR